MEKLLALALVVQVATEGIVRLGLKQYTVYVATAVGVAVAVLTQTGLLASLGVQAAFPAADWVLAGIALAGGAGAVQALKQGLAKQPPSS